MGKILALFIGFMLAFTVGDAFAGHATADATKLWPRGVIAYEWDTSMRESDRREVRKAFDECEAGTCVRFVRRSNETDYLKVINRPPKNAAGSPGRCMVGRLGGEQVLELNFTGYRWVGNLFNNTIRHEIGHCLGLLHEQQRSDRDGYIEFIRENIRFFDKSGEKGAVSGGPLQGPFRPLNDPKKHRRIGAYDYYSVMHYPAYYTYIHVPFRWWYPTMIPKDSRVSPRVLGQPVLSSGDLGAVNELYCR